MDDLVKRLRFFPTNEDGFIGIEKTCEEAASRIEQLEAALHLIGKKDAELDEPALWIDDNTPLGLFIDMTLGEKKDD
jgi:hypothetical protein